MQTRLGYGYTILTWSIVHTLLHYLVFYAGCPILWESTIQPLLVLKILDAGCIVLSAAFREAIGIITLLEVFDNMDLQCIVPLRKYSVVLWR